MICSVESHNNKTTEVCKIRYYYSHILERGNCSLERLRKQSKRLSGRLWELEFGATRWHTPRNVISIIKHCPIYATCYKSLNRWDMWQGFGNWRGVCRSVRLLNYYDPKEDSAPEGPRCYKFQGIYVYHRQRDRALPSQSTDKEENYWYCFGELPSGQFSTKFHTLHLTQNFHAKVQKRKLYYLSGDRKKFRGKKFPIKFKCSHMPNPHGNRTHHYIMLNRQKPR